MGEHGLSITRDKPAQWESCHVFHLMFQIVTFKTMGGNVHFSSMLQGKALL